MKPLLIGPAPGRGDGPPLSGKAGQRLAALCGLSLEEYLAVFDRVNVLSFYPGPSSGKGDGFPLTTAQRAFRRLLPKLEGRRVVLLGGNVARVAGVPDMPLLMWVGDLAVCPHPSGINRWWNNPAHLRTAQRFWRALAKETTTRARD